MVDLKTLRPTPARGWSQKKIQPGGARMEPEEMVDENIFGEEGIEPFDWEDYLYESWLEEHLQKRRRQPSEAGA